MIKFTTWNLENFFITPHLKYPNRFLKDKDKVQKIAETLLHISPDFLFLTEIGGLEDLKIFNRDYLQEAYEIHFIRGNSNRGIELAFMAKIEFLQEKNWKVKASSYAKSPIGFNYPHEVKENKRAKERGQKLPHRSHRMSRDLLQIDVSNAEGTLQFILLGVHFKSKLDKDGIDWNGQRRRLAECRFSAEIYDQLNKKNQGKVPIFITGDFNGEAHSQKRDPEFRDLYALDLIDFSEILDLPEDHRYSFVGMNRARKLVGLQLDYFFMPKNLIQKIIPFESGFYRYLNENGEPYPIPQNPGAKHALPSDHYPIVISLDL